MDKQMRTAIIVSAIVLAIVSLVGARSPSAQAQGGGDCDGCPPCTKTGCSPCPCVYCGKVKHCSGGPGGETPPQPTHPPSPGDPDPDPDDPNNPDPPPPTTVSGPPVADGCGDWECDPGESCMNCPSDCRCYATATPRPWDADGTVTYQCTPWPDCPGGWADVTMGYHQLTGNFYVIDIVCLDESACVSPTPGPGDPTPEGPSDHPCDYDPVLVGGILRQPCDRWPGWHLEVEAQIPPAAVLRNPWPRGIVGQPNCFWYQGASDVENWSSDKAEPCPYASPGVAHDEASFECGNGTTVGEGAQVNYQVGVAWRQWRSGDDAVFGYAPPEEVTWRIKDREFNGGTVGASGPSVCYTFETSSYGLPENGPVWNPDCQDEDCDCDERVIDWNGEESYQVSLITYWYPEYAFRYDEYVCSDMDWGTCGCYGGGKPHGATQTCSAPPGICNQPGEWYGKTGHCDRWQWKRRQEEWTTYDMTAYGHGQPVLPWAGVTVAGADASGHRCSRWTDKWPCYIPVPVLELQPQGTGWEED